MEEHRNFPWGGGRLKSMVAITLAASLLWFPMQNAKTPPIWTPLAEKDKVLVKDWMKPERATVVGFFRLDLVALRKQIDLAPMDDEPDWRAKRRAIAFPLPDGTFRTLLVSRRRPASIAPQLKDVRYVGLEGIDSRDESGTAFGSITTEGFMLTVKYAKFSWIFGPAARSDNIYVSYTTKASR